MNTSHASESVQHEHLWSCFFEPVSVGGIASADCSLTYFWTGFGALHFFTAPFHFQLKSLLKTVLFSCLCGGIEYATRSRHKVYVSGLKSGFPVAWKFQVSPNCVRGDEHCKLRYASMRFPWGVTIVSKSAFGESSAVTACFWGLADLCNAASIVSFRS